MANTTIKNKKDLISKANSRIFAAVIIASLIVSASLVATKILWDQRSFQSRVIDAKREVRDKLEQNYENAQELQKSFEVFEEGDVNSQLVLDALPSKYDYAALTSSIEKLAETGGYTLEAFTGTDESADAVDSDAEPSAEPIEFTVEVSGSYDDIQNFVKDIERSIRPFKVTLLTISANDESEMTATAQIETYYQPTRNLEITTRRVE